VLTRCVCVFVMTDVGGAAANKCPVPRQYVAPRTRDDRPGLDFNGSGRRDFNGSGRRANQAKVRAQKPREQQRRFDGGGQKVEVN